MTPGLRERAKAWRRQGRHPVLVRLGSSVYRHVKELRILLTLPFILVRLRRTRNCTDADELTALAYEGFAGAITPIQVRQEIAELTRVVRRMKPRRVLEIGTARGGTLFLITRAASDDAHVISVDLPGGWFGGGYPRWKTVMYHGFARGGQRLDLIRADSHQQATVEQVRRLVGEEGLDFLFIDADHTYEGVKRDFESYAPLVRSGGIVALHDVWPNRDDPDINVDAFWREIAQNRAAEELIADAGQSGNGIGVVRIDDGQQN